MAKKLSSVIKRMKMKEERKATSIVADLDSACERGMTAEGRFSLSNVAEELNYMLSVINSEDYKRDELFSAFQRVYTKMMAPDARAGGVFHPSQLLDGCCRQMYYELSGQTPSDKIGSHITGALQRTFDVGTWYHIYFQNLLYKLGLLAQAEVPVVNKEKYINGKADGLFNDEVFGEKTILEIKTMNSWNYQKAIFRPFVKHEFQASLYARQLGATKILYLYINKDTSEIKDFLMPVNEEQLVIADEKMDKVISAVKEGVAVKRSCRSVDSENAIVCPFRTLCFTK